MIRYEGSVKQETKGIPTGGVELRTFQPGPYQG